jgi:uncharacterized protein YcbK (DUF882 family)
MGARVAVAKTATSHSPGHGPIVSKDRKQPAKAAKKRSAYGKPVGWVVKDEELRAAPAPAPSGRLHIVSVNNHEEAEVNLYNEDGSYNEEALETLKHLFRCRRTGMERAIEPRLLTLLSHVADHFGKPIELLSGYRYQRRQTSNHFRGSAADIRIAGVNPRDIRAFASTLDAGGVGIGYYPRVGFVHLDIRPDPSYRWIDYSKSNPDSRDKQPPRGWKRKKLQS